MKEYEKVCSLQDCKDVVKKYFRFGRVFPKNCEREKGKDEKRHFFMNLTTILRAIISMEYTTNHFIFFQTKEVVKKFREVCAHVHLYFLEQWAHGTHTKCNEGERRPWFKVIVPLHFFALCAMLTFKRVDGEVMYLECVVKKYM